MSVKSPRIAIAVLLGVGLVSFLQAHPAVAQTSAPDPLEDFKPQENRDPFSSRGDGGTGGLFDLYHRAVLGGGRNSEEFSEEQRDSLNTAADDFRTRQRKLLEQQQQAQPAAVPVAQPVSGQ